MTCRAKASSLKALDGKDAMIRISYSYFFIKIKKTSTMCLGMFLLLFCLQDKDGL